MTHDSLNKIRALTSDLLSEANEKISAYGTPKDLWVIRAKDGFSVEFPDNAPAKQRVLLIPEDQLRRCYTRQFIRKMELILTDTKKDLGSSQGRLF